MKAKVCGLREPDNIAETVALGVDYLGFIFHPASPRFAGQPKLAEWMQANDELFHASQRTGVFVNAELDYILNTVHDYRLDWVQLHGNESPTYCRELKLLWTVSTLRKAKMCKAFSIDPDFDFGRTAEYADSCAMFVFDTGGHAAPGGTGEQWDWSRLREYDLPVPFLLSGGIGPEDADDIRRLEHPQLLGVDLNSRFEEEPGLKDVRKLKLFLSGLA